VLLELIIAASVATVVVVLRVLVVVVDQDVVEMLALPLVM